MNLLCRLSSLHDSAWHKYESIDIWLDAFWQSFNLTRETAWAWSMHECRHTLPLAVTGVSVCESHWTLTSDQFLRHKHWSEVSSDPTGDGGCEAKCALQTHGARWRVKGHGDSGWWWYQWSDRETGKSVKTHACAPTSSGNSRLRVCTGSSKEKNQH